MQRDRDDKANFVNMSRQGFSGFGSHRSMMSSIFGRDPFDDPFFSRPFGSAFGSSIFDSNPDDNLRHSSSSKGPIIEELIDSDDDGEEEELEKEGNASDSQVREGKALESASSGKDPLVEHPEDQEVINKDSIYVSDRLEGTRPRPQSVSFKKVTYGGINGAYYSATTTRKTGSDGVVLEESKQADKTTGQAAHRISRGMHGKGHSVTRKLDKDGKVDTIQTLHNLEEDELAGFEQAWNGDVKRHVPRWNEESNSFRNTDLVLPFAARYGGEGDRVSDKRTHSSGGRPKKIVTIAIE